jgi:hypothetical protein
MTWTRITDQDEAVDLLPAWLVPPVIDFAMNR